MTADGSAEQPGEDVLIEARGSLAVITLNRPRALNALTAAMRAQAGRGFPRLAREPPDYAVVIQSAVEKAFCAGGDVREIVRWGREDKRTGAAPLSRTNTRSTGCTSASPSRRSRSSMGR